MKFKQITLHPSEHTLDVIITDDASDEQITDFIVNKYKVERLHWNDDPFFDYVCNIHYGEKHKLKRAKRILMVLKSMDDEVTLVHELIHVLWYAAKRIGYEMTFETQEWQAILYEYLFKEVKKDNFKTIKIKKRS